MKFANAGNSVKALPALTRLFAASLMTTALAACSDQDPSIINPAAATAPDAVHVEQNSEKTAALSEELGLAPSKPTGDNATAISSLPWPSLLFGRRLPASEGLKTAVPFRPVLLVTALLFWALAAASQPLWQRTPRRRMARRNFDRRLR